MIFYWIQELDSLLTTFCNFSLSMRICPKNGNISDKDNFCSIVLTSNISRIIDTVITKDILQHIKALSPLNDHPYGFCRFKLRTILICLAALDSSWFREAQGKQCCYSKHQLKASRHVQHASVQSKLLIYGIHPSLNSCIIRCLNYTIALMRLSFEFGVLHSLALLHTLFLLYINDLLASISNNTYSYVDDRTLSSSHTLIFPSYNMQNANFHCFYNKTFKSIFW